MGTAAPKYPVYREVDVAVASRLPRDAIAPRPGYDFLLGMPVKFDQGIVAQYAEMHRALDLFEYLSIAVEIGVLTDDDVQGFAAEHFFIPGGCELGVYPTGWLKSTLERLEKLGRAFVTRCAARIRRYDNYQVRAVGFLAERLGSYLLLSELRRRYPQGLSREMFGFLCALVAEGASYDAAKV